MCGITGLSSPGAADRSWLRNGRDAMAHRGPDDAGEWWSDDGHVGLAHRRLAIIDLSPAGHQPMLDANGECCITFNGEIYNFKELRAELSAKGHTFVSASDTEVMLAAYREWGADFVARLNGMFAFALYDIARGRLLIARDRAGEKPLFYRIDPKGLRFASELKALFADPALPREVDPEALDCFLAMGYVPGARCILKGFQKLPPAHAISYDVRTGDCKIWRYWQLPGLQHEESSEQELVAQLEELLAAAVKRQMVADVPLGVLLSGGVDSALVTAMAARSASRVKTFTIAFPGFGVFDESAHARLVARYFGTEHTELEATSATWELLPRLARQFDEPLADSSMIPTFLVSQLVRQHCTVAVGGDGGDELFGGYRAYSRLLKLDQYASAMPRPLRRMVALSAGLMPVGARGRSWAQAMGADFAKDQPEVAWLLDGRTRRRLLSAFKPWTLQAERVQKSRTPVTPDLLQRSTRLDFENYLPEDILVKVDRASMLNSLEVRAPMLDVNVVEFAFSRVPSRLKASTSQRKILLRRLAAAVLPPEFDSARKQGFSIPLDAWISSHGWGKQLREVLLDPAQQSFDHGTVAALITGAERGRKNGERLFALLMFELWRRSYNAAVAQPMPA